MRFLAQRKCAWVPAAAGNKCMQRAEPCPDQHNHVHALNYGPASVPNDLHNKTTSTISKTVYIWLK